MKTLNKQRIISIIEGDYSEEAIRQAVAESWESSEPLFDLSDEGENVDAFFSEFGQTMYKSNFIQSLEIEDSGRVFSIRLHENYADSGSVNYAYSFEVRQL